MKFDRFYNLYKDHLIFLLLIFISLILIFSNNNRQIEYLKLWVVGVFGFYQNEWKAVYDYIALKEENERLLRENTRLALEVSAMNEMRLENERLRNLIGFKQQSKLKLLAAKVIGKHKKGFINDIILNVGISDSIKKNMPLVIASGLVGKIYQVGKRRASAQLLIDQNFCVSSIDQRSRVRGIIAWKGGEFCVMNEVPKRSDVRIGDWVVTSGYGEIFPPGLKIGKIIKVSESPRGLFKEILVKPAVDFNRLEEVLIITGVE